MRKISQPRTGSHRPYYTEQRLDAMVTEELRRVDLLPEVAGPIRVERFIEKRFNIVPSYEDLPVGLLGMTCFGQEGVQGVVIAKSLTEERSTVAERRINSTLAHEAGHMLLHEDLFKAQSSDDTGALFEEDLDTPRQRILCREDVLNLLDGTRTRHRYDGRWWEYQANMVIGALLLPRCLVDNMLSPFLVSQGQLAVVHVLDDERRVEAIQTLSDAFEVNPAVARIRVDAMYPALPAGSGQLPL